LSLFISVAEPRVQDQLIQVISQMIVIDFPRSSLFSSANQLLFGQLEGFPEQQRRMQTQAVRLLYYVYKRVFSDGKFLNQSNFS